MTAKTAKATKPATRLHESLPLPADSIFLTIDEARAATRLSRSSIYALLNQGALQAVKIGKARRITRSSIENLAVALAQ